MAISAELLNRDGLEINIPLDLVTIPISFFDVYKNYWQPTIEELSLPTIQWIFSPGIDVNCDNWVVVKKELLCFLSYIEAHPFANSLLLRSNNDKDWIDSYIVGRVDGLIGRLDKAFQMSEKCIFYLG